MRGADEHERFEKALLPHLNAAYNLARWLTRDEHDAEDLVQAAYLRALKFFGGFRGANSRAWLLTIVRNTCHNRLSGRYTHFDEPVHSVGRQTPNPEAVLLLAERSELLKKSLAELPEQLSYRNSENIAGIPLGKVMSRLSRERQQLQQLELGGSSRVSPLRPPIHG